MKCSLRPAAFLMAATVLGSTATPAEAQQAGPSRQVISANPFGLLLEFFNAEYERQVSQSSTAGIGGSFFETDDEEDYLNADVFFRFYPSGQPIEGWSFGTKVGITKVDAGIDSTDAGTYFGFGFDTNWSWLLGANNNFYVGVGFGLKRLLGTDDEDVGLTYIPTFRIVNVGFAF